jgi:hypothetical protein
MNRESKSDNHTPEQIKFPHRDLSLLTTNARQLLIESKAITPDSINSIAEQVTREFLKSYHEKLGTDHAKPRTILGDTERKKFEKDLGVAYTNDQDFLSTIVENYLRHIQGEVKESIAQAEQQTKHHDKTRIEAKQSTDLKQQEQRLGEMMDNSDDQRKTYHEASSNFYASLQPGIEKIIVKQPDADELGDLLNELVENAYLENADPNLDLIMKFDQLKGATTVIGKLQSQVFSRVISKYQDQLRNKKAPENKGFIKNAFSKLSSLFTRDKS